MTTEELVFILPCDDCDSLGWVFKDDIQEGSDETLIGNKSVSLWAEIFPEWERFLLCPYCDGLGFSLEKELGE